MVESLPHALAFWASVDFAGFCQMVSVVLLPPFAVGLALGSWLGALLVIGSRNDR